MPGRDAYPEEFVPYVLECVQEYADEHGLVVNDEDLFKIEYSETHGGRCFCDPENRVCVCKEINNDLNKFGGTCLCRVLMTPEYLDKLVKRREAYARRKLLKLAPEEIEERKKQGISKYEEAKRIIARMTGKK